MNFLLVFIGGGIGSVIRYGIYLLLKKEWLNNFPLATLISNFLASLILGIVLYQFIQKHPEQSWIHPLVVVGFCGGFSTFSTFGLETFHLFAAGNTAMAIANVLLSLIMGVGIFYLVVRII